MSHDDELERYWLILAVYTVGENTSVQSDWSVQVIFRMYDAFGP